MPTVYSSQNVNNSMNLIIIYLFSYVHNNSVIYKIIICLFIYNALMIYNWKYIKKISGKGFHNFK